MKQVQEAVSEITILMADAFADDQPEDATKYEDPPEDDFEDDEDDEDLEDEEE